MPARSKYRNRKRNFRRRRTRRKYAIARPSTSYNLVPRTKLLRLKYVETTNFNPGVGTLGSHIFRANSCYDPFQSATGHQPLGWDQVTPLYNHYVVVGSKVKCTFMPATTTSGVSSDPLYCGIFLSDDLTFSTDPNVLIEQGKTNYRLMNTNQTSPGKAIVRQTFSAKRFFNVTNVKDNITRIGAGVGANPSEEAYYVIWAAAPLSGDPPLINVTVELEYLVLMGEPKELAQS